MRHIVSDILKRVLRGTRGRVLQSKAEFFDRPTPTCSDARVTALLTHDNISWKNSSGQSSPHLLIIRILLLYVSLPCGSEFRCCFFKNYYT